MQLQTGLDRWTVLDKLSGNPHSACPVRSIFALSLDFRICDIYVASRCIVRMSTQGDSSGHSDAEVLGQESSDSSGTSKFVRIIFRSPLVHGT